MYDLMISFRVHSSRHSSRLINPLKATRTKLHAVWIILQWKIRIFQSRRRLRGAQDDETTGNASLTWQSVMEKAPKRFSCLTWCSSFGLCSISGAAHQDVGSDKDCQVFALLEQECYSWLRLANVTISLTAGCCHHFPTLLLFAIRMPTDKTPSAVGFGQHSDAAAQALHQSLAMDKTFQKAIAHMSGSAPPKTCYT